MVISRYTAGEQTLYSPVVSGTSLANREVVRLTYLPLANIMFASGKLLPLAIWALANHLFASGSLFLFASDEHFPTSERLRSSYCYGPIVQGGTTQASPQRQPWREEASGDDLPSDRLLGRASEPSRIRVLRWRRLRESLVENNGIPSVCRLRVF